MPQEDEIIVTESIGEAGLAHPENPMGYPEIDVSDPLPEHLRHGYDPDRDALKLP